MTEDLQAISEELNAYIIKFNETHDDYKLDVKMDFLSLIDGQLSILISNGILGVLLVILLLSLLLNIRLSLWVAWGNTGFFFGNVYCGRTFGSYN